MTSHDKIIKNINEILELLKSIQPKAVQPVEEWEDVSEYFPVEHLRFHMHDSAMRNGYRFRKIDGLHNGPAFVIERRKS